jgi:mannose-6-phosphate isomerase-like protein (cupin superfamily)
MNWPRNPTKDTGSSCVDQVMSLGLYRIPVDGADHEHPHASDEVYINQRGQAQLDVEGTEIPVVPGSVISVDRGREHCFTKITEEPEILVVFAPPEVPE